MHVRNVKLINIQPLRFYEYRDVLPLILMTTPFVAAGQDRRTFDIFVNWPHDHADAVESRQRLPDKSSPLAQNQADPNKYINSRYERPV